ncbi:MAG: hypothetical protein QXU32_06620 [Nitrososphaerales archaeon]
MEKVIEKPTYVTIKDKHGNMLLAKSLLGSNSRIVHDESSGVIDLFTGEQRIWHSRIDNDAKIEFEDVGGGE